MWYSGLYNNSRPESQTHYTNKCRLLYSIRATVFCLTTSCPPSYFSVVFNCICVPIFCLACIDYLYGCIFCRFFLCPIVVFSGSFITRFHTCILTEFSRSSVLSRYLLSLIYGLFFYTLLFLEQVSVTFWSPLRQPNTLLLCSFILRRSSSL